MGDLPIAKIPDLGDRYNLSPKSVIICAMGIVNFDKRRF